MNLNCDYTEIDLDATMGTPPRVELERFVKSPRLAELKVAYRARTPVSERPKIRNPQDAASYLRRIWCRATLELNEDFVVVCLNGNHQATGWVKLSSGGRDSSPVDPRLVFAVALQTASTAILVAHNHPSGNTEPSEEDLKLTRRLRDAGELLTIRLLDHIILTREASYSFREHDLI